MKEAGEEVDTEGEDKKKECNGDEEDEDNHEIFVPWGYL